MSKPKEFKEVWGMIEKDIRKDTKANKEEIKENIKRVEKGQPLSISLAVLDGNFKKEYFKCMACGINEAYEFSRNGLCLKCQRRGKTCKEVK